MRRFLLVFLIATPAWSLDREAFTFSSYDLTVRVEPGQERIGVRGFITVRNDSDAPQSNLVLQISSTLNWSSIRFEAKPLAFTTQTYTSDIDHTGALREAIVILPRSIAPKSELQVEVGYEGVLPQDVTRLSRIGVPADVAKLSDWDRVASSFTAVRGIGYVAWYPIATEAVSLSDENAELLEVGRWKQRETAARMKISMCLSDSTLTAVMNDPAPPPATISSGANADVDSFNCSEHTFSALGEIVPTFSVANFAVLESGDVRVRYLYDHKTGPENYLAAVDETAPLVAKWFGNHRKDSALKAQVVELPEAGQQAFESGSLLFIPLTTKDTNMLLSSIQQLTHLMFPSPRSWIANGLARYAQARFLEEKEGRAAAIEYLRNHEGALTQSETLRPGEKRESAAHSLINTDDDFYLQTKAMYVWWMLRDLVGEDIFTTALHDYKAADDRQASDVQKLFEAGSHRDLEWLFDDWVYRDRGLPDFRITYVYPREIVNGGYMITVTVENLGDAGAEVPVVAQSAVGESAEKVIVKGKSSATVRIHTNAFPSRLTVNDGSVPESDMTNNAYKIAVSQ